jgi:hypothetical protein
VIDNEKGDVCMSFTICFNELIEKRIEFTNDDIAKTEWYNDLQDKLIEIQNRSPENKKVLSEYNPISEEIFRETVTTIYRQAFLDGMEAVTIMAPILAPK